MPSKLSDHEAETYAAAWMTAIVAVTDVAVRTMENPDDRIEGELLVLAARHRLGAPSPSTSGFRLATTKLMWAAVERLRRKTPPDALDRLAHSASGAPAEVSALIQTAVSGALDLHALVKAVEYPSDGVPVPTRNLVLAAVKVVQAALSVMAHPQHSSVADLWAELGCITAAVGG